MLYCPIAPRASLSSAHHTRSAWLRRASPPSSAHIQLPQEYLQQQGQCNSQCHPKQEVGSLLRHNTRPGTCRQLLQARTQQLVIAIMSNAHMQHCCCCCLGCVDGMQTANPLPAFSRMFLTMSMVLPALSARRPFTASPAAADDSRKSIWWVWVCGHGCGSDSSV